MGRGDFWPPVAPKFGERSTRNSKLRNTSWGPPHMPNMVKIRLGVWAGPIPSLSRHLGYPLSVFFVFLSRRPDETPRPIATLNGSYDAVSAQEVPFGVSMTKSNVWGSKPPKNVNFGNGNRRFKPNLQNFQMDISLKLVMRLTKNFNTIFGPWSRLRG